MMAGMPRYETTLVTDTRIYSTDVPISSHIVLKRQHRIPQKVYDRALHAVYSPSSDFLSLTEDAAFTSPDKFERLYDFLDTKYPGFSMRTRVRRGMFGSEERVGDVMRYTTGRGEPEHIEGFSEELMRFHQRRPVQVRGHRRRQ